MKRFNLLKFKHNVYSQNGEDGIIEKIFSLIGPTTKTCAEFGAWDGIHLSNTRKLIQEGWSALLIEGSTKRYQELVHNYKDNPRVFGVNAFVDSGQNSLAKIIKNNRLDPKFLEMDFLSIDIDGLDYDILRKLDISPRVICVEINAGHSPLDTKELPQKIAATNIGQPLGVFNDIAREKKYHLVAFNGNGFYLRADVLKKYQIPEISPEQAYRDFIDGLSTPEREWLYLVNLGLVPPYYQCHNPFLTPKDLAIPALRAWVLRRYSPVKKAIYDAAKKALRVQA
jgi:hypothetical protein